MLMGILTVSAAAEEGIMLLDITVSDKVEIKDQTSIDLAGSNSFVIKQATGAYIWLANEEDANNQEIINAIKAADPSLGACGDNIRIISGDGTYAFKDAFGNTGGF